MFGKHDKNIFGILGALAFLLLVFNPANAQETPLQGIVYELESSHPLWNVTVKNLRSNAEATTDREGRFAIDVQLNDYLSFATPGYQTDTAFIYEEGVRRIYMLRDEGAIALDEVVVSRMTDSRLDAEIRRAKNEGQIMETSQNRGGIRISPSRLFGQKGKNARSNHTLLVEEKNNRRVDRAFSARLIASLVPLDEEEIALFRDRFRPTVDFVEIASPEDIRIYIMDSYKKFRQDENL